MGAKQTKHKQPTNQKQPEKHETIQKQAKNIKKPLKQTEKANNSKKNKECLKARVIILEGNNGLLFEDRISFLGAGRHVSWPCRSTESRRSLKVFKLVAARAS